MVKSKVRKLVSRSSAQNPIPPIVDSFERSSRDSSAEKPASSAAKSQPALLPTGQGVATNGHSSLNGSEVYANGSSAVPPQAEGPGRSEIADKVKQLVRLAQEQGYLTYNDINEILPHNVTSPEELEEVL